MKNQLDFLNYPIVIKRIYDYITFSAPDLGIHEKLLIPERLLHSGFTSEVQIFADADFNHQWQETLQLVYLQIRKHLLHKKWKPDPSQVKSPLKKAEKDYSLPEFQKKLSEFISISENTIRREIQRGKIIAFITDGGHRRIPESEIQRYLAAIETKASPQ